MIMEAMDDGNRELEPKLFRLIIPAMDVIQYPIGSFRPQLARYWLDKPELKLEASAIDAASESEEDVANNLSRYCMDNRGRITEATRHSVRLLFTASVQAESNQRSILYASDS